MKKFSILFLLWLLWLISILSVTIMVTFLFYAAFTGTSFGLPPPLGIYAVIMFWVALITGVITEGKRPNR